MNIMAVSRINKAAVWEYIYDYNLVANNDKNKAHIRLSIVYI